MSLYNKFEPIQFCSSPILISDRESPIELNLNNDESYNDSEIKLWRIRYKK